jgi:hypothetical protein
MRVAIFKWNFHFKIMVMNKIVVRKEEALKKVFKGVSLDSLAVGERSMVTKICQRQLCYHSSTSA